jgi:YHS domain-containing protein
VKRIALVLITASLALSSAAFASTPKGHAAAKPKPMAATTPHKAAAHPPKPAYAVCPVTGEKVKITKATLKSVYKGKVYYFCCSDCKPKFDRNPAKYIKTAAVHGKPMPGMHGHSM